MSFRIVFSGIIFLRTTSIQTKLLMTLQDNEGRGIEMKEPKHPYHGLQNKLLGGHVPAFSEGGDKLEKKVLGREVPNRGRR
jgi:hypothetical protein